MVYSISQVIYPWFALSCLFSGWVQIGFTCVLQGDFTSTGAIIMKRTWRISFSITHYSINTVWSGIAMWRHRTWSNLARVMLILIHSRIFKEAKVVHDDVIKWNHFPRHWPFVRGFHRWSVNCPHKASDAALWCFLICAWTNSWENNGMRPHYDATLM